MTKDRQNDDIVNDDNGEVEIHDNDDADNYDNVNDVSDDSDADRII